MRDKLAFGSYDLHIIATREGHAAVSATLPNGKRTSRLLLNKHRHTILVELLTELRMYNTLGKKK